MRVYYIFILVWSRTKNPEVKIRKEKRNNNNNIILLHKDKDLSTSQHFYKSVPDDKHSNTQYFKQEYK